MKRQKDIHFAIWIPSGNVYLLVLTESRRRSNCKTITNGNFFTLLERIYNPIMSMGFSAMFTFQLDNTKR